jgi:hypothetical protein
MTSTSAGPNGRGLVDIFRRYFQFEGIIVVCMLIFAVGFNLFYLYPEVAVKVTDPNDGVLHLLLTVLTIEAVTQGQNFTDPWVGAPGMGFPLFHYYHHLPFLSTAVIHILTLGVFAPVSMMNWTTYLLLSLFPLSIYWSLQRYGFNQLTSAMGGIVASLTATPGLFGFDFDSYVWRGHGLYTQLWAMVLLPPSLALSYRVMRDGKGYFWATLLLAATLMSHLIYGSIAFVTLGALTFLPAIRFLTSESAREAIWVRWKRLLILLAMVLVVTSYFLVPFFLDRLFLNLSVWEQPEKYNSYGYAWVIQSVAKGDLFDFDRFPSLTVLVAVGFAICLRRWKEERYLIPLAIFLLWLLLYFGRSPWGPLIDLLPLGRDVHIHRVIAGVHLGGIYLMAIALAASWRWAMARGGVRYLAVAVALTLLIMLPVYSERRTYLAENALVMRESQQALATESQDLSALFEKLKRLPPGRVYAGGGAKWGVEYIVGSVRVHHLLIGEGLDMMGGIYHALSLNSDLQILFDENRWELYNLYNVRYVVAPEGRIFPDFVRPLQQFGRHRLYQVETTGYFDLVGSGLEFAGGRTDFYPAATAWLASELPRTKQHPTMLLGRPAIKDESSFTGKVEPSAGPSRGTVLSEGIGSNFFTANVAVERDSLLMLKATYHPNWRATVGGIKTDTVMLMPSFVGVQLPPGDHEVRIKYRPRRLRAILIGLGLLALLLIAIGEKRSTALSGWFTTSVLARMSGAVKRPRGARRRQRPRHRIRR